MKPLAFDICCCSGGATKGLQRAGYHVIGVDIAPQPTYCGDGFIQMDACEFLRTSVLACAASLIWASPPCQRYSTATKQSGNPDDWPDLIPPIRELLKARGNKYIIENVIGAPLIDPIMLCGAMFGLGVVRHRLFECSFPITQPEHPKHQGSIVTGEYVTVAGNGGVPSWTFKERAKRGLPRHIPGEMSLARWSEAMGIDWMDRKHLVEAIPPAYAEWLGRRAL